MALSANSVPLLLFTVVSFALAALLLRLNYHHRASRVFAFLLIVRGMGFTYQVGLLVGQPDADYWWRLYPYTAMLTTIVASYFAALHPRPLPGMRSRWAPVPFIAGALVLEVLYLADHRLYWDLGQLSSDTFGPLFGAPIGPLFLFAEAYRIPFAVVALRCAMAWAAAPSRRERATHLMVSFGFIVVVALDAPVGLTSFYTTGRPWLVSVQPAISLALVLLTLVYVAVQAVREPAPDRRGVAWYVALVPFALASTVLFVALPDPPRGTVIIATSAFWRLVLPALTVYALLRHHLFDLDLRVKRTVRRSTVAAAFVALYLVGSQVAARLLPEAWGPLVGLSFAGLLLLGFAPLQRAAERFADAVFPGVSPSEAYLQPRRIEAYRSALEDTLARGAPSAEDVGRLARLRRELGLSERDHEVLLQAVAGRDLLESRLPTGTEVLGRYRVLRQLGEGGSGRAYLAKDLARGDLVVVKTLQGTGQEHGLREARAVQALHHPNVVALRDVRREAGHTLLVMDHLEGGSLRDRLERKVLGGSEYRRVASDLLRALEAVHAAGIVHRDVKPSNVLLTKEGRAKLADFGVARVPGMETTLGGGAAVGTVRYMSPEQARGRDATVRSDLYSAAATLWEARTGRTWLEPKPGESAMELQIRASAARPFKGRITGDPALTAWFAKALHPDPRRRFANARAMREALERALAPSLGAEA